MRRWAAIIALGIALLTACGGSDRGDDDGDEPSRLGQTQAELLATVRFRNFDAGVRAVTITIPPSSGQGAQSSGRFSGWVDFASHFGYGSVEQGDSPLGTVVWNADRLAVNESAAVPAPLPVPQDGWRSDLLDPGASTLTQILAITLNLGSDRPENPLLLRQSDAAFLRGDEVDGVPVHVLVGPSPVSTSEPGSPGSKSPATPAQQDRIRYWIDDDGLLRRVQVRLAGTTEWTIIDLASTDQTLDTRQLSRILR